MSEILDHPVLLFGVSFVVLWFSVQAGAYLRRRGEKLGTGEREELEIILASTLTLLGLIIGFTFSMANTRYDQRKQCEATEANAIGTEYVRADLLPAAEAARVQGLLKSFVDQRVLFYVTLDEQRLRQIAAATAQLESDLWAAVRVPAAEQRTPTTTLAAAGMNDVLNSEAYTQAAWWNRIPVAAWSLMAIIAICADVLLGYTAQRAEAKIGRFFILPLIIAIAFLLIADIDSPRGGLIRMHPKNLESLSVSLRAR